MIKKILSQKVLGYSADFKTTYIENECLLESGKIEIRYTAVKQQTTTSQLQERPYVAVEKK